MRLVRRSAEENHPERSEGSHLSLYRPIENADSGQENRIETQTRRADVGAFARLEVLRLVVDGLSRPCVTVQTIFLPEALK
jgi:hypothetical protein